MLAPETAAHAAGTSALLPMLTLGIPGSPTAAVLLGGLLIWGLQPGPLLFVEQKDFVWGLIASIYLGNVAGLIVVLTTVPLFAAILRVPFSIIAPIIVVICAVGAYTVHNALLDISVMLVFGVLGYLFKKLGYPACAARPRARARRHGRELVPAGHAGVARQPRHLLVEPARRLDRDARAPDAVLAADLAGAGQAPAAAPARPG